jgi:branched-chain amino acid transport system permease protein
MSAAPPFTASATPRRGALAAEALPIGIFLVLAALPLVAMTTGGGYLVSLGARVMIFAIAAVALDLLIGFGGLISFGHAAFIGLGAYAVGILASHGIVDALIALPAALAVSALYAFLTGLVCLRTSGVYFIMITLAFGQMAFFTATSLAPYGGDDGLTMSARSTLAGFAVISNERAFYAARWSSRASAGCCAAPRTIRSAWRRSASTFIAFSLRPT